MMNGRVHAILILTLIPRIIPNPTAAKNEIRTSSTPNRVTMTRDSIGSQSNKNTMEKKAMIKTEAASSIPLLSVISSRSLAVVPLAPASVIGGEDQFFHAVFIPTSNAPLTIKETNKLDFIIRIT